jgi:hypothetical protein
VAHYNIDEQGCTLYNVFKVPPDQSKIAAKIQGHIYGMIPDGKTTHHVDKAGNLILKTTLKIDEPSTAEFDHFYHQCDVIAAMVFIKPPPTQEDIDMGQETVDVPPPPSLAEPVGELDDEGEPLAISDGLNKAVEVEDPSGDPDFDTGGGDLEPDDEQDNSPLADDSDE